jgi:hypothetical protein
MIIYLQGICLGILYLTDGGERTYLREGPACGCSVNVGRPHGQRIFLLMELSEAGSC